MHIKDVFPPSGHVQRLYCDDCKGHLYLAFADFDEDVSGIPIKISGLPVLRCEKCGRDHLPDRSRFAIIEHHRRTVEEGQTNVAVRRKKLENDFGFGKVKFRYDPDDYFYIPGLYREFHIGFLTPVFFKREVLLKYDASPNYTVKFASPTYGTIEGETFSISFGVNKNGKVVMWLGDIADLPESEQYYLRSENVDSDHMIGSEFYEGQVDCIFTPPSKESQLFAARSEFLAEGAALFGAKIAHLDQEVYDIALSFNAPVVDTPKERRHVADSLNKVYIESFDNKALATIARRLGGNPDSLGSLKRLQVILEATKSGGEIAKLLSPFFVLYDLRVAYSHLTSVAKAEEILASVANRLRITRNAGLIDTYNALCDQLLQSLQELTALIKSAPRLPR
ncbi:hypothetical protein [Bradyrhizobium sp.]|jgi:hypothetical protein|uniref:hypothetical protein n=1 Tax=Bradyrhizobium sp. TaxID=376 RepID=UPI003C49B321